MTFRPPYLLALVAAICMLPMGLVQACDTAPTVRADAGAPAPRGSDLWEYKQVVIDPKTHERLGKGASEVNVLPMNEADLNALGQLGWELAGSWVEEETAYPNFSPDAAFFTGLQPNVRPMRAVLLFKRRKP